MLLKDTFKRLVKLGLGRANFVLTKKILRNSESLATIKQTVTFLHRCSALNIFPTTIENVKVNFDHGSKSLEERSKLRIKRFVLNESKRTLRRLITIKLHEQKQLDGEITSNLPPQIATKVRLQRYLAYNTASKLHYERFQKLLAELQKSDNTANTNSQQDATNTEDTNQPQDTTRPENRNDLVTELTNSLNNKEVNLLAKGPKFSLSPGINEQTTTTINIAFYRLANQIRWKQFRELNPQNPQHTDFLTYPQSKHFYKPDSTDELEQKLRRIHNKLHATIRQLVPRKKWSNISNVDKKTIKDLKEKDVICLPSDKGTEFCIIQKDRYSQAALDHLNDSNTYQKVPRMTAKTVENKVNLVWKNICSRNKFPPFVVKSFVASNTDLPKFYHGPKY